jgi:hypothetical protein
MGGCAKAGWRLIRGILLGPVIFCIMTGFLVGLIAAPFRFGFNGGLRVADKFWEFTEGSDET